MKRSRLKLFLVTLAVIALGAGAAKFIVVRTDKAREKQIEQTLKYEPGKEKSEEEERLKMLHEFGIDPEASAAATPAPAQTPTPAPASPPPATN